MPKNKEEEATHRTSRKGRGAAAAKESDGGEAAKVHLKVHSEKERHLRIISSFGNTWKGKEEVLSPNACGL